jgi:ABC-2 type transport system ATP-binding protein
MKRKLGLLQALMTDPPVLVLDEPTSGLDPLMIEAVNETIDERARSGRTTVMLSSHVLSEVDRVCSRIGLIRKGRLVKVQTLDELRAATPRRLTVLFSRPVEADVPSAPGWIVVTSSPRRVGHRCSQRRPFVSSLAGLPVADALAPLRSDAILHLFADTSSC